MKMQINQAVAEHLKRIRVARGHSLGDAAKIIGISKGDLSRYENGKRQIPAWVMVAYKTMECTHE